jgi:hypothetical protein
MIFLFILQNAYKSKKYNFRNNIEWFADLCRSHSGKRLSEMLPDNGDIKIINSTPVIGNNAKSCYNADLIHIKKMIEKYNPDIICACGKISQEGCSQLNLNFVPLPHPAWRQLSKVETRKIKNKLNRKLYEPI